MKKIALLLLFLSTQIIANAEIILKDLNGNDLTNGEFSDVVDTASLDPYEFDLDIINTSNSTIAISCSRVMNNIVTNSESYFCWDVCYTASVNTSQTALSVNAFDTLAGYFHAYYNSLKQVGESRLRFKFTNVANAADTANITLIFYSGTVGIAKTGNNKESYLYNAFPNPTNTFSTVKYRIQPSVKKAVLKVNNALGIEVIAQELNTENGSFDLNTQNLAKGVYSYSLWIDDAMVESKKLLITK